MYQSLQPVKVTRYWGGQEVLVLKLIDNNNLYLYRTLHFLTYIQCSFSWVSVAQN